MYKYAGPRGIPCAKAACRLIARQIRSIDDMSFLRTQMFLKLLIQEGAFSSTYIYIYIYMYTYTHYVHIGVGIYIYIHVYVYIYLHLYLCVDTCRCIYAHIYSL